MSIRAKSISRKSSTTFNKKSNLSSNRQLFSGYSFYNKTKSRITSPLKHSSTVQRMDSINSNKIKSPKIYRKSTMVLTNFFKRKKMEQIQRFYNPSIKYNLKLILKNIRNQFVTKYNGIYYPNYIEIFNNDNTINDNTFFLLYDCYSINNILNKKDFHSILLLKEYDIYYNNIEFLIRYYDKKEIYIIMKYLLNFVYKYDELCYNINREIFDSEQKEELITKFHYITSSKYLYENLLETDSFKGIKYLLKRIDLTNKKAQYDYSYLDLAKNKKLSEENKYIISAIKVIIEFMNNRKYLEKKLIKNFPFEKVPNCLPNYFSLGKDYLNSLKNYINLKKFKKIGKPGDETCELINNIEKEKSKSDTSKENKNKFKSQKNVLFNIDEKIIENESSISNDEPLYLIKKSKKENAFHLFSDNLNFNIILPFSLYEESEKENKITKEKETMIKEEENTLDYKLLYDIFKLSKTDNRLTRDPEIYDNENFIYTFLKFKNKNKNKNIGNYKNYYRRNSLQLNYKDKNEIRLEEKVIINNESSKTLKKKNTLLLKKNEKSETKFNKKHLKLGNDTEKYNNILKRKTNNLLLSSLSDLKMTSSKNNKRINQKLKNRNKIEPFSVSPSSKNNISSTIFSNANHFSPNLSPFHEKEKIIFSNNNNLSKVKNKYLKKLKNSFSFDGKLNAKTKINGIYTFKKTKDFIEGFRQYYNKIKSKRELLFKNISSNNKNISQENKSDKFNYSPKQRNISPDSPKIKDKTKTFYLNNPRANIKYLSNYFKKQISRQIEKEKENITLKQIIKNSEIYTSGLS